MTQIHDFHAHIYYDPDQVDAARALAEVGQAPGTTVLTTF